MTARAQAVEILPRLLTEAQAADYLGDIPVTEIKRQGVGRVLIGRYARYDRFAIDAWLDERSGLGARLPASAGASAEDDAEAALARFEAGR